MTVPSEVNRSGPYLGNGVTTVFGYGFKIVNQAHLRVIRTDAAGNETVLTLGANYSVAGVGNAGGGSITVSPAPASGQSITILRAMPFTQNLDLENQGAYYAEDVERAFDEAAMRDQQLAEGLNRTIKVPSSTEDPDGAIAASLAQGIIRLADSADNLDIVAENVADVNTVADNIGNVNTVADNIAGVNAVAANIASVNTVAGIAGNVNTVAGDHDEIVALAGITGNINTVAGIAPDVEAVAGVADDIPTIADNITDVAAFGKIYLGPKTSDPTVRNNGTALIGGDLYFNTASKMLRVYDGTAWQAAAGQSLNMAAQSFTGNGSATAFTLAMAPALASNILVWQGGVRQVPITDYTVSGSTLNFATAPGNGEAIDTLVVATVSTLYTPANGTVTPQSLAAEMGLTIITRAAVASISMPAPVVAFRTLGYSAAGDGGGGVYKRVASQPSHGGKVQSADGAWWELVGNSFHTKQFGILANGTDETTAISGFFNHAIAYPGTPHYMGDGIHGVSAGLPTINKSNVMIIGSGASIHDGGGSGLTGCIIKWVGASGNGAHIVDIRPVSSPTGGRTTGIIFTGIAIDMNNGTHARGMQILSIRNSEIDVVLVNAGAGGYGMGMNVVSQLAESRDPQMNVIRINARQLEGDGVVLSMGGDPTANVSMNKFYINAQIKNTPAIISYNSDNNIYEEVRIFKASGGSAAYSIELHGSNANGECARAEKFNFLSINAPVRVLGTEAYTYPSRGHTVSLPDYENFFPAPNVGGGASFEVHGYWAAWTPTIQSIGGTSPTLSGVLARWCRMGNKVTVQIQFKCETAGTGNAISISEPIPRATWANNYMALGRNISNAKALIGTYNSGLGRVSMTQYDGAYPMVSGEFYSMGWEYEVPGT